MQVLEVPLTSLVQHPDFKLSAKRSSSIASLRETFFLVTGQRAESSHVDIETYGAALAKKFKLRRCSKEKFIEAENTWFREKQVEVGN